MRKKSLALLLVLTMLATLFVGVMPASAAASYSAGAIRQVSAGVDNQYIGQLLVEFPAAELNNLDYVSLRLPTDFKMNIPGGTGNKALLGTGAGNAGPIFSIGGSTNVDIKVPATSNALATNAPAWNINGQVTVDVYSDTEMRINLPTAIINNNSEKTAYFYVEFTSCLVASGFSGNVDVTVDGKSGSPFGTGKVTIATAGTGSTAITIDSVKSITSALPVPAAANIDYMRLKEDRAGAWGNGQTIKFKLPAGYKWQDKTGAAPSGANQVQVYDGLTGPGAGVPVLPGNFAFTLEDDSRTMVITNNVPTTKAPAYILLKDLDIAVTDETLVKMGDVTCTVSGSATSTPGTFVVCKYGDYSSKAYAIGDPKTVIAGRVDQEIGEFAIEEGIAGSLIKNRTITATLVGAKWANVGGNVKNITKDSANSSGPDYVPSTWTILGSAGDMAKVIMSDTSTSTAIKAAFKGAYVNVSPVATGDVKIVFGGSAGVTGEVVVAKVVSPVTASIDGSAANIEVGASGVEIPPIIIAETQKEGIDATNSTTTTTLTLKSGLRGPIAVGTLTDNGAVPPVAGVPVAAGDARIGMYWIDNDASGALSTVRDSLVSPADAYTSSSTTSALKNRLQLEFPMDVLPTMPTKVEVTEGDIVIDQNGTNRGTNGNDGRWYIELLIKSTSTVPSKIKISGVKLNVSRTVPTGDFKVAVKGGAVVQTTADFPGFTSITSVKVANVVNPADQNVNYKTSWKIGETKYTSNGVEKTMDVAPYVNADGRTMMPVRYVSLAMGVTEQNIIWDEAAKTVTLMKGDKVVQLKIGSSTMLINGVNVSMDTAPEIKEGRTMLPLRFLAQAFGYTAAWDAATNTASIS